MNCRYYTSLFADHGKEDHCSYPKNHSHHKSHLQHSVRAQSPKIKQKVMINPKYWRIYKSIFMFKLLHFFLKSFSSCSLLSCGWWSGYDPINYQITCSGKSGLMYLQVVSILRLIMKLFLKKKKKFKLSTIIKFSILFYYIIICKTEELLFFNVTNFSLITINPPGFYNLLDIVTHCLRW